MYLFSVEGNNRKIKWMCCRYIKTVSVDSLIPSCLSVYLNLCDICILLCVCVCFCVYANIFECVALSCVPV